MANTEQRSNKMTKKPKKDAAPAKSAGSDRPVAPMTAVIPKGKEAKLKNKQAATRSGRHCSPAPLNRRARG